jgi:hypothetical protein
VRGGQSSVEPLIAVSAILLVLLGLAHWQFEALYGWIMDVALQLERQEWFHRIVVYLESLV